MLQVNGAGARFLRDQNLRDQEATEGEEDIDAGISREEVNQTFREVGA